MVGEDGEKNENKRIACQSQKQIVYLAGARRGQTLCVKADWRKAKSDGERISWKVSHESPIVPGLRIASGDWRDGGSTIRVVIFISYSQMISNTDFSDSNELPC